MGKYTRCAANCSVDGLIKKIALLLLVALMLPGISHADTFPPDWSGGAGGAIHYSPALWPAEPVNAADCGDSCGGWKPYTRFQQSINDPRAQDDSNGGTAPQNYVNIASSCIDQNLPSIYYYLHQGASPDQDVIMFRWRVEQIANTYATGPNAGGYNSSNPWNSALWTVLFDIDGSGFRSLASHLNGSSGNPSEAIDMLAGIWSQSPTQSIDYINDSNVHLLGHNPTAFIDQASGKILNFQSSGTPVASWPNGSSETVWDYGTSRARLVSTRSCNEYFVDYQIPVAMLDASALGGPKITRSTPISMMFCTANSLNNPFQKDCAINRQWAADSSLPAPFGDYISFDKTESYSQPIVAEVEAVAPSSCGQDYMLTARVQDVLTLTDGAVSSSVKAVDFYYWYDANGSGDADEVDGVWIHAASGASTMGTLNGWEANWNSNSLPKGRYLIGVQAVDDNTLVDDGMVASGVDNRTFSYLAGDAQSQVYIDGAWISGQDALFPVHSPVLSQGSTENWYGNPDVTGVQTANIGVALNTCGVAPTLILSRDRVEVAPGETVVFTMTLSNSGNPDVVTVDSLANELPVGFSYQTSTTSGDFGTANPAISVQSLSWTFGTPITVPVNGSLALSFLATASSDAGNYNDSASATTSFGDLASDPVSVAVGSARLALSITPGSYSISPGGQVNYTFNYSNPSTVAVDSTTIATILPADTTFVSCSDSCSGTTSIVWSLGTLPPGASGTTSMVVELSGAYATNSLALNASLAGTDPAASPVSMSADSTIFVNVPVSAIAAFTLEKTASAVQVAPGASVTYTLAYHNYGGVSATNVVLMDTLPTGMTYISSTGGGSESGGVVSWNLGIVAADASGSVTVTVVADIPFESPNPANNSAEISWDGGTAVSAAVNVGVSGLSCSTYYFRDTTANVGFDGTQRIATILPIPLAADTGASLTVTAPVGASFLEAIRFYQNPATTVDTEFSGTVNTTIYIDRANGPALEIQGSLYDYNSVNGVLSQLGQQVFSYGGNQKGLLSFSVPVSGTLQKDHRLLWVIGVRSTHANTTFDVQLQYNGTATNVISGGSTFADSGASFCVTPPANLSLNKTVDLASVPESTTTPVVYTLTYANSGSTDATNVAIVDTLPTGISFTSATLNAVSITPTGSNPYTFAVGTVAANTSGTLVINAEVSNTSSGLLTNTASLTSDQTSAVTDTTDTLVGAPNSGGGGGPTTPELYISKGADISLLGAGQTVAYSVTVVNAGNADATNVVVTDDFPEQSYFTYQGCSAATGTCSENPTGTLSWNIGTLTAGTSASLTYQMQSGASGLPSGLSLLNNSATVSDNDYCTGTPPASCSSNTVGVSVSGNPELALTLTADNAAVVPGDLIEYTLVVTNNGSSAATDVLIVNPVPDATAFVEITSGSGSFDTINNQLLFPLTSLAAGVNSTFTFTVQVANSLVSGSTTITDTATATAANAGSVTDTVSSTATAAPAVGLTMSGTANVPLPATTLVADVSNSTTLEVSSTSLLSPGDYIRVNSSIVRILAIAGNQLSLISPVTASSGAIVELAASYNIVYQNNGNAAATNVQISETLPAGWLYVASSPLATSAPSVGVSGVMNWDLATVNAGDSGSLRFVALPINSGNFTHSANLTADGAINELANATTLVGGLTVQKTAVSPNAQLGGSANYSITISNSLTVPVNGVEVRDLLPAGFTYASSTTVPDSFESGDQGRPIWIVNVPAGGSVSIDFTVDIAADAGAATYQNEVAVVAPPGVGVVEFDALATRSEDVTVLVNAGLMSGVVTYDGTVMAGVWLNFYENNVLAYREYTDNSGYFERVLEVGNNWRLEISSDTDNGAQLTGLELTLGTDPESFSVTDAGTLTRNFVYSLIAPTVNSQSTDDSTPVITGTYPSIVNGGVLTVVVNGVTYSVGSDLAVSGDNWTLTIPLVNQLADNTYEVTATITKGVHSRSDSSTNELLISSLDSDGDGISDVFDIDDDNDGIPDLLEGDGAVDKDGDGVVDSLDLDSDNDGLLDLLESGAADVAVLDADNNGQIDGSNAFGPNGLADAVETSSESGIVNYNGGLPLDTDNDGIEDFRDLDSDADGIPDVTEGGGSDPDSDGIIGTGIPTVDVNGLAPGSGLTPPDNDGDGTPDFQDVDPVGNNVPLAIDDNIVMEVNTAVIIGVLDNDSDPEGTQLIINSTTLPGNGMVVVNGDNTITFTPATDFRGIVSFTYTIEDASGNTATATVEINVVDPPTITLASDVFVDAVALFTKVDLGVTTAIDYLGNPLPVSQVDGVSFFWPGINEAIWQATDDNGFTSFATQLVKVRPLVSFSKDQTVAEGNQVVVKVVLNGPSPVYPLNVSYAVSGTAVNPDDHDLLSGIAVIGSGTETSITINTMDDGLVEGDETIVLTMDDSTLNQGVQNFHTIILSEQNIAPGVILNPVQNNLDRFTVAQSEGTVVVTATVSDPNINDTHSYDWSLSDNMLTDLDSDDSTFSFDPFALSGGVYEVWLNVTDDGIPAESNVARVFIRVVASLPVLDASDTDLDGIADNVEGFADTDRDGIPDYLDSVSECNVLPEQGQTFDGYLVEGDPGVCIRLGNHSLVGETGGVQLTDKDISLDGTDELIPDPEAANVGGIFDFIVTDVPDNGQSVNIVLPQRVAIPEGGVYRKLNNGIWFTFIEDSRNLLWSTAGEPGYCPPPGSADFTPGLTEGHWCVQLTIEDGGPNDADDDVNRMIGDPGGVGVLSGGNYTTIGGGAFGFWWLMFLGGLLLPRHRRVLLAYLFVVTGYLLPAWVQAQTMSDSVTLVEWTNTTPLAINDRIVIDEGQSVLISVLENDMDADGDELIIVHATSDQGNVIIEGRKRLRFVPDYGYSGPAKIRYTVYDGQGEVSGEMASIAGLEMADFDQPCEPGDDNCQDYSAQEISTRLEIKFANNDHTVGSEYYREIEKLASLMNQIPGKKVTIEGHTSIKGSDSYNQRLSERRARAVADVLVEKLAIDIERVAAIGYGESRLIDEADSEEAHTINRRIEAVFDGVIYRQIKRRSGIAEATVEVMVNNLNWPPEANDDEAEVDQYRKVLIPVLSNDTDPDQDTLQVIEARAENGKVSIVDGERLEYSPNEDFYGIDNLHYSIQDPAGLKSSADVKTTVSYVLRLSPWYAWADVGSADGSSSVSSVSNEFSQIGINATLTNLDNNRNAGQFGLGYSFNESLALELGLVDLGEVRVDFSSNNPDPDLLTQVHPQSAEGLSLAGVFRLHFDPVALLFRLGLFQWKGDFVSSRTVKIGSDSIDGSDLFFGLGADMMLTEQFKIRVLLQRFAIGKEDVDIISAGLIYHFED